jgi:hypothetical protein
MSAHTGGITPLRKLTQPAISTNYCCHEHAEEIFKPLPVNSSLIKIGSSPNRVGDFTAHQAYKSIFSV